MDPVSCESAWSASGAPRSAVTDVARPSNVAVDQDDEQPQHDGAAAEQKREIAAAERAEADKDADRRQPPQHGL